MEQQELVQVNRNSLLDLPANNLLDSFGAGRASPGSGSAAALLAILACKMIVTVCEISTKKECCNESHKEFGFVFNRVREFLEPRLKELFDADARDFDEVIKLRVLRDQAEDVNEKSKYTKQSSKLLETATDYTFEIAEHSLTIIDYGIVMFEHGWHAVRGDSGVSISAAMSALMSCIFVISLNLKTLKSRKYSKINVARLSELQRKLEAMQVKAFSCVTAINSESVKAVQLELLDENLE